MGETVRIKAGTTMVAGWVSKALGLKDGRSAVAPLSSHDDDACNFADRPSGDIDSRNGCRTSHTFDRAAARSPLFSELSR